MSIDLSSFHDETIYSISIKERIEEDSLDINGRHITFIGPIKYEGHIYRSNRDKFIHININYRYEEICGRCLEAFIDDRNVILSGKLTNDIDKITLDEDDEIIYYKGDKLDLSDNIIDTVILSLPMKPLCNEKCKGLCPKCGVNHNEEECNCAIEDIDPRLEKLKDFFLDE